jgi:hypothetical protein
MCLQTSAGYCGIILFPGIKMKGKGVVAGLCCYFYTRVPACCAAHAYLFENSTQKRLPFQLTLLYLHRFFIGYWIKNEAGFLSGLSFF